MRTRGFSLLELMVAVGIFLGTSVLIFSFFRFGTRSFQQANAKNLLQTDALRVMESLQVELTRTSLPTIKLMNDTSREMTIDTEVVRRDAISFAGLQNWRRKSDSLNYDPDTGAPLWNRYHIFYATKDTEGQLIRVKIDPSPPPNAPLPMLTTDFDQVYNDDPNLNDFDNETPPYVVLSKNAYDFRINEELVFYDARKRRVSYDVALKLREKHKLEGQESGARRQYDYYELKLRLEPGNSFPNDL